ncbi:MULTISPECIES: hypothetical protein [Bacillaceae]|uniref:hypothetical protein n=1 Tax=Bacillaceae TaxID=186817 RepID=UPI000E728B96|nr:hypothetical protein [Bacillus sp. PK3_68]RJS59277.1 hypothetical protein CJ483_03675 [Bacillus sp. PK3_68]
MTNRKLLPNITICHHLSISLIGRRKTQRTALNKGLSYCNSIPAYERNVPVALSMILHQLELKIILQN